MAYHTIITPEQVSFRYPLAGLVTRAMAWVVDQLILTVILILAILVASAFGTWSVAVIVLAKFALDFGYWIWFESRSGQTPGKRLFRLRVISAHGGRLESADVMTRNVLRIIDSPMLIPFVGFVGAFVALLHPLRQRLGDLAAGTIVVARADNRLPSAVLRQRNRVNTFADDPVLRNRILARVDRNERDLIFDLMQRRDELDQTTREELFGDAAAYFRERYGLPTDSEYLSDEQTVLNLALVVDRGQLLG